MDNLIAVKTNKDGKVELTLDELNKMLDDAYERGFNSGRMQTAYPSTPPTLPWTPTNPTVPTTPYYPTSPWWSSPTCLFDTKTTANANKQEK